MKLIKELIRRIQDEDSRNVRGRNGQLKKVLNGLSDNIEETKQSVASLQQDVAALQEEFAIASNEEIDSLFQGGSGGGSSSSDSGDSAS